MLENVGLKSCISEDVGTCESGNLYKITTKYYIKNLIKPYIKSYIRK